ncbi:hypothetical protein K501DRAFT_313621 [Backusella circina FSU 941]|nr:hypothetical protein K501DRAFT_313621 [Backusella circina FSU 941]
MDKSNTFQLWSPPILDLSLDTFSDDLIQQFDKKRQTISTIKGNQSVTDSANTEAEVLETSVSILPQQSTENTFTSCSIVSSTVPSEPEQTSQDSGDDDEPISSSSNLFRKSSTFLKKRLSQNSSSAHKKDEAAAVMATNPEEISNIVSRQYPPKPLQYSSVIEPPADTITTIPEVAVGNSEKKKKSGQDRSVTEQNTSPKRRSFFSLRFC